jgi:hypothetical protein
MAIFSATVTFLFLFSLQHATSYPRILAIWSFSARCLIDPIVGLYFQSNRDDVVVDSLVCWFVVEVGWVVMEKGRTMIYYCVCRCGGLFVGIHVERSQLTQDSLDLHQDCSRRRTRIFSTVKKYLLHFALYIHLSFFLYTLLYLYTVYIY